MSNLPITFHSPESTSLSSTLNNPWAFHLLNPGCCGSQNCLTALNIPADFRYSRVQIRLLTERVGDQLGALLHLATLMRRGR